MNKTVITARIRKLAMAGVLVASLALVGCKAAPTQESKTTSSEQPSSEALLGEFETVDLSGEAVNQDVFGKSDLTMLNIWGTFCKPCINEMPELGELSREYADQMQIVGLVSDVSKPNDETAQEIIDHTKADYLHILPSKEMLSGFLGEVQAVPTTVFLDKEGKQVGNTYTGARSKKDWESIIKQMLENV